LKLSVHRVGNCKGDAVRPWKGASDDSTSPPRCTRNSLRTSHHATPRGGVRCTSVSAEWKKVKKIPEKTPVLGSRLVTHTTLKEQRNERNDLLKKSVIPTEVKTLKVSP